MNELAVPGSPGQFKLTLSSGMVLTVDEVLVSVGRYSNIESLNLPAAGVQVVRPQAHSGGFFFPDQRASYLRRG